jgi:hypothetical protein
MVGVVASLGVTIKVPNVNTVFSSSRNNLVLVTRVEKGSLEGISVANIRLLIVGVIF